MSYIISGIIGLLGGLIAIIYGLIVSNRILNQKVAVGQAKDEIKDLANKVDQAAGKVTEDERDYAKAKDDFNNSVSGDKSSK